MVPRKKMHIRPSGCSWVLVSNSSMLISTNMVKPEAATGIAGTGDDSIIDVASSALF